MHIPDGFVDIPTAVATGAVSLGVVAYAARRTGRDLGERTVPLLGVTAAFIFAAQMLNFPVAGGTSGHFLGAVLAVALMGPWAAVVVMTAVLLVQAVGMADGGITALGANVLNMGVVAVFAGYVVLWASRRARSRSRYLVALAVASWTSVVLASAGAALELAVSGTVPIGTALPAMLSVHMIIGLGEAVITTAVVVAVLAVRPDLVKSFGLGAGAVRAAAARAPRRARLWGFVAGALVVALALAIFISPFASSSPDGLERVAVEQGFETAAAEQPVWDLSPLGDYRFPWVEGDRTATALAGLAGTAVLFGAVLLIGRAFGRRRTAASDRGDPA